MKAAQAFWLGNFEAFQDAIAWRGTSSLRFNVQRAIADTRDNPTALLAHPTFNFWRTRNVSEEITTIATETIDRAVTSMERLQEMVEKFRSNTRNDLASMKANSDRVQTEVNNMAASYSKAVQLLTSTEFVAAMLNAERFVAAMQAMHELQATRVVLQMFDNVDVKGT